jgi:hypothetical protein
LQLDGLETRVGERLGRRPRAARAGRAEQHAATTEEDGADGGHLHEVRRPDRPLRRHHGVDPRVEQPAQGLEEPRRRARAAAGHPGEAREHERAHLLGVERGADGGGVRADDVLLEGQQQLLGHELVARGAEPGVHAVRR